MSWVDLILVGVLFLFGLRGYFKGLFRETFSLAGWIVGFLVAVRYDEVLAQLAQEHWKASPLILKGAAFIAIFFVVYFLFSLAGWLLHRSAKLLFLQTINRIGGIAVGLGKGTAIAALAIFALRPAGWLPVSVREQIDRSVLAPPFSELGEGMVRLGREQLLPKENGETLQRRVAPAV